VSKLSILKILFFVFIESNIYFPSGKVKMPLRAVYTGAIKGKTHHDLFQAILALAPWVL
jgi:hypothetical protein